MRRRLAGSFGAMVMLAASIAGCGRTARTTTPTARVPPSTAPAASSGAPHLVVCGQLLSAGAAGPVVYDIASRRYPTVTNVTVGGVIYVKVSDSCTRGAAVRITPVTAFDTVRTVRASDGRVVLVELHPEIRQAATLTATPSGPSGPGGGGPEELRLDVAVVPPASLACNPRPCTITPIPASEKAALPDR
jgi:hypothetical protein